MSVQSHDRIYEVFAAQSHETGLEHIGSVHADDADIAALHGCAVYDEEDWIVMKVVPRDRLYDVDEYAGDI